MQPLRRKIIFKLSFLQKHYIEEIKKNVQLITGTLPSETVSDTLPQPCLAFFDFRLTLRISNYFKFLTTSVPIIKKLVS